MGYLMSALFAFIAYLALTASEGSVLQIFQTDQVVAGVVIALLVGYFASKVMMAEDKEEMGKLISPLRHLNFMVYLIGPFMVGLVKANLDVAKRVITGEINPGIVKVPSDLKSDFGVMMLANSITLTPGTLTVDVDDDTNDLYVHWIDVKSAEPTPEDVYGDFGKWIRRIVE